MKTNFNQTHNKRTMDLGLKTKYALTKTLGQFLEKERQNKNLSISDVAKILNIKPKLIQNTEKGIQKNRYTAIGIMLKFYKKKIKLNLIDEQNDQPHLILTKLDTNTQ